MPMGTFLVRPRNGSQIIWHNGEVLGYDSIAAFNPVNQKGVIILRSTMSSGIDAVNVSFGPHNDELSDMVRDLLLAN